METDASRVSAKHASPGQRVHVPSHAARVLAAYDGRRLHGKGRVVRLCEARVSGLTCPHFFPPTSDVTPRFAATSSFIETDTLRVCTTLASP